MNTTTPDKPIRESGFELLRIVSMLMIVAFHTFRYIDTSGFTPLQMLFYHGVRWYGLWGVNCFVMISAWFLVGRKTSPQKLKPLLIQTAFYCILLFILHILYQCAIGDFHFYRDVVSVELRALLAPFWTNRYWFITAYVFLYLTIPLLNRLAQELSPDTYRRSLLIVSTCMFLFQTLTQDNQATTLAGDWLWLCYVYFLTAYLKLYGEQCFIRRHAGFCLLISYAAFVFSKQLLTYITMNAYIKDILVHTTGNSMRYSFMMLLLAVELFYLFERLHFKSRAVNTLASYMFGVYLFHENKVFHICEMLACGTLLPQLSHIPYTGVFMLTLVCILFVSGVLVDALRQKFFVRR